MSTNDQPMSNKHTGVIIVRVQNSNPNGDLDTNQPRIFDDTQKGWISNVAAKRRIIRDPLVDNDSLVLEHLKEKFGISEENYRIFESRMRGYEDISELEAMKKVENEFKQNPNQTLKTYFDARLCGTTLLQQNKTATTGKALRFVRTGCLQMTVGESVGPVNLTTAGISRSAPFEKDKLRAGTDDNPSDDDNANISLAHDAVKMVNYGVYVIKYYISPNMARKTLATDLDVEVLKQLIPLGFQESRSTLRNDVSVIAAFHATHGSKLGTFPEWRFTDACHPTLKPDVEDPKSDDDVIFPTLEQVKQEMLRYNCTIEELLSKFYGLL